MGKEGPAFNSQHYEKDEKRVRRRGKRRRETERERRNTISHINVGRIQQISEKTTQLNMLTCPKKLAT